MIFKSTLQLGKSLLRRPTRSSPSCSGPMTSSTCFILIQIRLGLNTTQVNNPGGSESGMIFLSFGVFCVLTKICYISIVADWCHSNVLAGRLGGVAKRRKLSIVSNSCIGGLWVSIAEKMLHWRRSSILYTQLVHDFMLTNVVIFH